MSRVTLGGDRDYRQPIVDEWFRAKIRRSVYVCRICKVKVRTDDDMRPLFDHLVEQHPLELAEARKPEAARAAVA